MSEVQIVRKAARELNLDQWLQLQEVGMKACEAAMNDGIDVAAYMGADSKEAQLEFFWNHQNPNNDIRAAHGRNNKNQSYFRPHVSVATIGQEVVGWAYASWHNVSGGGAPEGPHNTSLMARGKRAARLIMPSLTAPHAPQHDFVHLREVYVDPAYQGNGLGTGLVLDVTPETNRPSRAYTYPGSYKKGHDPVQWFSQLGYSQLGDRLNKTVAGLGDTQMQVMEAAPLRAARAEMQDRLQLAPLTINPN